MRRGPVDSTARLQGQHSYLNHTEADLPKPQQTPMASFSDRSASGEDTSALEATMDPSVSWSVGELSVASADSQRPPVDIPTAQNQKIRLRNLSGTERMMKNMVDNGVFTIGTCKIFNSKHVVEDRHIQSVLEGIKQKYEILNCNIAYDEQQKDFYFFKEDANANDVHVDFIQQPISQEDMMKRFQMELSIGIQTGQPLWRGVFYRLISNNPIPEKEGENCQGTSSAAQPTPDTETSEYPHTYGLVIIISHAIVDGVALIAIGNDFLVTLNDSLKGKTNTSRQFVEVSPPYEKLVPEAKFIVPLRALLVFGMFAFQFSVKRGRIPFHRTFAKTYQFPMGRPVFWDDPDVPRTSQVEYICLPGERVEKLKQLKRSCPGGTFTSLIMSILATAFLRFAFQSKDTWPKTSFAVQVLRDPRPFFSRSKDMSQLLIANYIASSIIFYLRMKPLGKHTLQEYLLKKCSKFGRDITRRQRSLESIKMSNFWIKTLRSRKFVETLVHNAQKDKKSMGRFCMFMVSNIGEIPADLDEIQIKELHAIADQAKCGDCILNFLVTVNGKLHWSLCYPNHIFDRERMKALKTEILEIVDILINE